MEQTNPNQSMQSMMEESEQEFRAQFDPTSTQFHGGNVTPVPVGGVRVPQSMSSMYPENVQNLDEYIQPVQQVINYGPEYDKITEQREEFMNFKKTIAKISQILEAILRHNEAFKTKGDTSNEAHIAKHAENIKKETDLLATVLAEVQPLADAVLASEFKDRYDGLTEILVHAKAEFKNKEDLTDFGFKLKKYSANAFTDAGKLLDKLKKIKKEHATRAVA